MAGRSRLRKRGLWKDGVAGLINAVVSVPDGLASAALAGVNPVYGLYTSIAGPVVGSSLVSAQRNRPAKYTDGSLLTGTARVSATLQPAQRRMGSSGRAGAPRCGFWATRAAAS